MPTLKKSISVDLVMLNPTITVCLVIKSNPTTTAYLVPYKGMSLLAKLYIMGTLITKTYNT